MIELTAVSLSRALSINFAIFSTLPLQQLFMMSIFECQTCSLIILFAKKQSSYIPDEMIDVIDLIALNTGAPREQVLVQVQVACYFDDFDRLWTDIISKSPIKVSKRCAWSYMTV